MYDSILKYEIGLDMRKPGHLPKKFVCPSCGQKKKYVRYFNFTTGEYLPEDFGRCDRENNCGYFEKPTEEYFKSLNSGSQYEPVRTAKRVELTRSHGPLKGSFSTIGNDIFLKNFAGYEANIFCQFLVSHFGRITAQSLINKYLIGTSKKYKGANVFWQVDGKGKIRSGKIMLYAPDGHRRKDIPPTWVHTALKLEDYNL